MPEPSPNGDPIDNAAQDWFLLMTSGAPTNEDRARFATWRQADPRHQAAYNELCAIWTGIDDLCDAFAPPGTASPSRTPEIGESGPAPGRRDAPVRTGSNGGFGLNRRRALWGSLVAACVALVIVTMPDVLVRLAADHRTGVGEQARVDLPDGSIAWLNTNTAIAVAYAGEHRHVSLLRGEAQFGVAQDAARPFSVMARAGVSTALGTVFSVRDDGAGAVVTVSEGTVTVASPVEDGNTPSQGTETARLNVDEQVRYREGAPPGPVRPADARSATAWRQGYVALNGMPLATALSEIDRYRRGRIVLLADTAGLEPVTARLSIAEIEDGLDALAATNGLTVTRLMGYLAIVR